MWVNVPAIKYRPMAQRTDSRLLHQPERPRFSCTVVFAEFGDYMHLTEEPHIENPWASLGACIRRLTVISTSLCLERYLVLLAGITTLLIPPYFAQASNLIVSSGVSQMQQSPGVMQYLQYQIGWNQSFPDAAYAAVCNVVAPTLSNASFPLWISSKTTASVTVQVAFTSQFFGTADNPANGSGSIAEIDCLGIEGSDNTGDVAYGIGYGSMVGDTGTGSVTFQSPLSSSNYAVACSPEIPTVSNNTDTYETFVEVNTTTKSSQSVGISLGGIAGTDGNVYPVDCIAAEPNAKALTGAVSNGQIVAWNMPFSDTNYVATCTDNASDNLEIGGVVSNLLNKTPQSVTIAPSDGSYTINDYECIASLSGYRIVDPYAAGALITAPGSVSLNPGSEDLTDFIVGFKSNVVGVAADGTAHVLIILNTAGTSITFQAPAGQGCFFPVNNPVLPATCDDQATTPAAQGLQVQTRSGYALVGYIAPRDYSIVGSPSDTSVARIIQITTSGDPADTTIPLQIFRPPQLLVHGLWSDPGTWFNFMSNSGFPPGAQFAANYGQNSGDGLAVTVPIVADALQHYLQDFRTQYQAAVGQVDIVAHSMGGLISRTIATQSAYKLSDNYLRGPVHKLITIATPLLGSPFAANLIAEYTDPNGCVYVKLGLAAANKPIAGAILLLEPTKNNALLTPTPSGVAMHAIVGDAGQQLTAQNQQGTLFKLIQSHCKNMNLANGYNSMFGEDNDLIVGISSQGTNPETGFDTSSMETFNGAIHAVTPLDPVGPGELQFPGSVSRVISLLNSSVDSGEFKTNP